MTPLEPALAFTHDQAQIIGLLEALEDCEYSNSIILVIIGPQSLFIFEFSKKKYTGSSPLRIKGV